MAAEADQVFKSRDQIVSELISAWQLRMPGLNLGPDSVARIWIEVFATQVEGIYLSHQLLHDDMFIQTANELALRLYGSSLGRPQKTGTVATGSVRFSGAGGTYIPLGSQVGAPRASLGDTLTFLTTVDGTIPDPGIPDALTASQGASGALVAGTYEYGVAFTTPEGETLIGTLSDPLLLDDSTEVDLTDIPLGGPGTIGRKIYRRVDGGVFGLVATITDNSTDVLTDNNDTPTALPPSESTAERLTLAADAEEVGTDYNVGVGAISELVDVRSGLSGVVNTVAFTGGSDAEDVERFRSELLGFSRSPASGNRLDLVAWATAINGVESAATFKNVDLSGTTALGTVTVRITGTGGMIPSSDLVDTVQADLDDRDLANITVLVGTFDANPVDVSVAITLASTYALPDIEASVLAAISDYINSVEVGGTVYIAGIYQAVFGLGGVETLDVTLPVADVTSLATEKATVGAVTIS